MFQNKRHLHIAIIIILAIAIKLSLFAFATIHAPQSKIMPDSVDYIKLGETLASKGIFALQDERGVYKYEVSRTPGYPGFLAVFHNLMKVSLNGIVLLQIAMTLLAAFVVYKTALEIDTRIAFLSAAIILFDPPITIFSLLLLTETLFLLAISLFMFTFTLYLKHKKIAFLVLSSLTLAAATYVRPISYYLGLVAAIFIIYVNSRENFKKTLSHALIFVLIVYGLLGIWQVRNYMHFHEHTFSNIERSDLSSQGLFNSYARNKDPYTKGMTPLPYYISVSGRCLMSFMTRPGNLKYFQSDILTATGKVAAYPWMIFWMAGFMWGVIKVKRNIYLQAMLLVILYFVITSIGGVMWNVGERFRAPAMPFIAIVSAYGWLNILSFIKKRLIIAGNLY